MLNCFAIEGRLKDNVVLSYDDEKKVSKASFHLDNPYKIGKKEYHNNFWVVVYGAKAEYCAKCLSAGSKVTVSGSVVTWSKTDEDGKKFGGVTINATNVYWD